MARQAQKQETPLDRAVDELNRDGYTVINPDHNAIKAILADLGKADLTPQQVEELCQTAKVVGLNGFTRLDLLPCGCLRIYKGILGGYSRTADTFRIEAHGIEGVKPCPDHTELVNSIKLEGG